MLLIFLANILYVIVAAVLKGQERGCGDYIFGRALCGRLLLCEPRLICKFTCLTDYTPASGLSSLGVFVFNSRIVQTRLTIVRNAGHMVLKVTVGYLVARCTENTCLDTMGDTVISFVRLTIQLPVCTRCV